MFRLKIAAIIVGGIVGYLGFQEYKVSGGTTPEPQKVDLARLEAGEQVENNHILVGEHAAVYGATVYAYKDDSLNARTPLEYVYYPIFSPEVPSIVIYGELKEQYGSWDNIPDGERPLIGNFAVLVKTRRFKTFGAIPNDLIRKESSVKGLVINRIKKLGAEESRLLKQSFPMINIEKVLILDQDRRPASFLRSWGFMILGAILILGGLASLVPRGGSPARAGRGRAESEPRETDTEDRA